MKTGHTIKVNRNRAATCGLSSAMRSPVMIFTEQLVHRQAAGAMSIRLMTGALLALYLLLFIRFVSDFV